MKVLAIVFALLCLSYAPPIKAQVITLDQLILLRGKVPVDIEEYLVSRGWKFAQAETPTDSTATSFWIFQDAHNKRLADFIYEARRNKPARVSYSTPNRLYFSAIKAKVTAYKMAYQGQQNENSVAWSYFRGAKYDVNLAVYSNPRAAYITWYTISVEPHGLLRWVFGAPGSPEWLTPEQVEQELKEREAKGDSLTRHVFYHQ